MNKKAIIDKFEKLVLDELNNIRSIPNTDDRLLTTEVLFKLHKIFKNFDELEPILNEYFKEKAKEDKWKDESR